MTKITSDDVWATDITTVEPPLPKKQNGFECGDADPDHFNWLFKLYSQALLTLSDAYDAFVISTNLAISTVTANLNGKTAQIADIYGRITRPATQAQTGMVEFADSTEAQAGISTSVAMNPDVALRAMNYNGTLQRLLVDQTTLPYVMWEPLNVGQTIDGNTYDVAFANKQAAKGYYMARLELLDESPVVSLHIPFQVFWVDVNGAEPVQLFEAIRIQQGGTYLRVFCQNMDTATSFDVSVRLSSDNSILDESVFNLASIYKLKLLDDSATA